MRVGMPGDADGDDADLGPRRAPHADRTLLRLTAPGVEVVVDLVAGGRIASLAGRWPRAPQDRGRRPDLVGLVPDGAVRRPRPRRDVHVPADAPTACRRGCRRTRSTGPSSIAAGGCVDDETIETELGPDWPFAGSAVQRFELAADHLTCRLELHADEPMPASIGWHPWFVRRGSRGRPASSSWTSTPARCTCAMRRGSRPRSAVPPPPGPWDDCFTDLRRPPVLRWPGFLELTIESDCPDWVVYTEPEDALCVEPQTAPPDALNTDPTVVEPGPAADRRDDLALAVARGLSDRRAGRSGGRPRTTTVSACVATS